MTELKKADLEKLVAFCGETLKGGEILSSGVREDALGERTLFALIDYGIKGTKKFTATEEKMAVFSGEKDSRLEDLDILSLRTIAEEHGMTFTGKPSKIKLVVAIRKKMRTMENIEQQVEELAVARFAEMEANFLATHGEENIDPDAEPSAYQKMNVGDLRILLLAREIEIPNKIDKARLIKLLQANE